MTTKAKSKPTTAKASAQGYKGHITGSRKGKVHELFDKQGPNAAWTLGVKLGPKEGTLRTWFRAWKPAETKKKASKPTAHAA